MLIVFLFACNGDDEVPYDPAAQLQIDLRLIDQYLSGNNQAVLIHPTGIRYVIDEAGNDQLPQNGDSVVTDYDIFTLAGELVDTSNEDLARQNDRYSSQRAYEPITFLIGAGTVIEGYEIGTSLLGKEGEGIFYIPSTLAYRNEAGFGIEPNQILKVRIRVIDIF